MKKRVSTPFVRAAGTKTTAREVEEALRAIATGEVEVRYLGSFSLARASGPPIYVVTAIQWNDLGSRRWGWFPDKEQAFASVQRNDGDLYECGYYPFIVVEEMLPGILPIAFHDKRWWFVWEGDYATGGYRTTPCPTKYENVIGFGMG